MNQEQLKEIFEYNGGDLIWKNPKPNWIKPGDIAGCLRSDGYIVIRMDGVNYLAHRLIFLWHHGYLPDLVDHDDRNPSNNKIENLLDSDKRKNAYNSGMFSHNTSGIRGVSWDKKQGKWAARFKQDGKYLFLGYHINIEDAAKARLTKEKEASV